MAKGTHNLVVAISAPMGAGKHELGNWLAERLGCRCIDKEVLVRASELLAMTGGDLGSLSEDAFESMFAPVVPGERRLMASANILPPGFALDDLSLLSLQATLLNKAASLGPLVILGRGAFKILRDHEGLFSIYLHASFEDRVSRFHASHSIASKLVSEKLVEYGDERREVFLRRAVAWKGWFPEDFDLTCNTSRIGLDRTKELVLTAADSFRAGLSS